MHEETDPSPASFRIFEARASLPTPRPLLGDGGCETARSGVGVVTSEQKAAMSFMFLT
jgi:hypothetical protein